MNRTLIASVLVLTLATAACGDDDADTPSDTTADSSGSEEAGEITLDDVPDVVGMSVDDATAALEDAGMTLRVVRLDGEDLAVTMDFVTNRVNVAAESQDGTDTVTELVSIG